MEGKKQKHHLRLVAAILMANAALSAAAKNENFATCSLRAAPTHHNTSHLHKHENAQFGAPPWARSAKTCGQDHLGLLPQGAGSQTL